MAFCARLFLAHPYGFTDAQVAGFKEKVLAAAPEAFDHPVECVLGRDDFQQNFFACGGWRGWPREVALGRQMSFAGLEPRFHAFVVPDETCGKATAEILSLALGAGKLVLVLDMESGKLSRAVNVIMSDPGDAQSGWTLEVTND